MFSTTELNPNFAVNTRIISAAIMRIFTRCPIRPLTFSHSGECPSVSSETHPRMRSTPASGVPRPNQTPTCPQYTSRLCHHHNVEEDMKSLVRHTSRRYRRSVPSDGNPANPSRVNHAHPPRYRRSVPSEIGQATSASHQPATLTKVSLERPEVDNRPRWKVSQKRPDRRLPSQRKLRAPTARYRRSVPSETGQATCASHQPTMLTKVSLVRPVTDLSPSWSVRRLARDRTWVSYQPATKDGPSWSVRLLAAPRSGGPAVVGSNNTLVPPGVCGAWPLLAVWDTWCHQNNVAHQFCRPVSFANVSSHHQYQTSRLQKCAQPCEMCRSLVPTDELT